MGQFSFLKAEWPAVFEAASKAEESVHPDPRAACFYARRTLELAVHWAFKHDEALKLPYQENLSALIHEPTFKQTAGQAVFSKARVINTLGNRAVHSHRKIPRDDALAAVRELFHVMYWLARTYARSTPPDASLAFDPNALPKAAPTGQKTADQLKKLLDELHERDEKLTALLADKAALDEELTKLRAEVAKAKKETTSKADTHDYSEAQTRDYFIDLLLKEAGWPLDQKRDREYPVTGMPNKKGEGFVDYVLWGDDGKPLGLVEAKRTRRDPREGQRQAELYATCLENESGQRPIIFYSNGYTHWLWDDQRYPPREVQGFFTKDELELLIQRRRTRRPLASADINPDIVERYYQTRAIRRVSEAFETDHERKALLAMATGSGKTRTAIALCDLLMRANWVKRVLFLADRTALVQQAVNAFKRHLPDSSPVNLVTERDTEGRVYVSTYPTMMGLIDERRDGQRRFGPGYFDLVLIDEAHRSVFQKYLSILQYFDSFLLGLTATPKKDVSRNTYRLFDLEDGVPTDAYSLEEAVRDAFLVPPKAVSVPLKFQREGIKYDELSEEEQEQWDALEWDDDGNIPDRVEAAALNKWLFNEDTVDKVLAHLMTRGVTVSGGDRIGKTILFAKNQAHADFIQERFNRNYPHYKGEFARVITFKTEYAQSLIDNFSMKDKAPHIAISVDMLDTGIDVPEVVNLVFFKRVYTSSKFWQMIGRGTRLCPDLFAPGDDKRFFYIFDYCQNFEFFNQNPDRTEGAVADSLAKRLFTRRLELIGELDKDLTEAERDAKAFEGDPTKTAEVRSAVAERLYRETSAMNLDNFVVRPKRRAIEKYQKPEAWRQLSSDAMTELAHEVAGLPSELDPEGEEAKRFDLLLLNLQLRQLRSEPGFERLRDQVKEIAGLLEEKSSIPMVSEQMHLIQAIQTDEWWQDVTIPMLESLRRRMRDLVQFIEKRRRSPIYSDFEDAMGSESEVDLPGFSDGTDYARFRAKAQAFLSEHQDHVTIHKLRTNRALTSSDLEELERMLVENGVGVEAEIERAKEESEGLGLFVRSMVGMDREAAKEALNTFINGKNLTANQIEFVNLIVNHLTQHGTMDAALLYQSPFTDLTPRGPDGIFDSDQVDELIALLGRIKETALAA